MPYIKYITKVNGQLLAQEVSKSSRIGQGTEEHFMVNLKKNFGIIEEGGNWQRQDFLKFPTW